MKRRVSMRLPFSVKFFTSTVPFGKVQSPSFSTVMRAPSGSAIHRDLVAPSDQNAAAGAYGMSPEAGCVMSALLMQPVCDRSGLIGLDGAAPEAPSWKIERP